MTEGETDGSLPGAFLTAPPPLGRGSANCPGRGALKGKGNEKAKLVDDGFFCQKQDQNPTMST